MTGKTSPRFVLGRLSAVSKNFFKCWLRGYRHVMIMHIYINYY